MRWIAIITELSQILPSSCLSGVWLSSWLALNFEHLEHLQEQSCVQSQLAWLDGSNDARIKWEETCFSILVLSSLSWPQKLPQALVKLQKMYNCLCLNVYTFKQISVNLCMNLIDSVHILSIKTFPWGQDFSETFKSDCLLYINAS